MEKITVTVRLDAEQVRFLDDLAEHFDRDRSYLIKQALHSYVSMHQRQLEDIRQAIAEADAGDFLSDAETDAFMRELRQ